MFKELLREVVDSTDGAVAGLLMGYDGITLENYARGGQAIDVESVGMEYSVVLTQIRQAAEMLDIGTAREITVQTESMTTVIRLINDEYFVAVALKPGGNYGKARFQLRMKAPTLLDALV